jgi:hypothetical protein
MMPNRCLIYKDLGARHPAFVMPIERGTLKHFSHRTYLIETIHKSGQNP